MREPLVIDLPASAQEATRVLASYYRDRWHVVGTLYYGDNVNAVILERELPTEPVQQAGAQTIHNWHITTGSPEALRKLLQPLPDHG